MYVIFSFVPVLNNMNKCQYVYKIFQEGYTRKYFLEEETRGQSEGGKIPVLLILYIYFFKSWTCINLLNTKFISKFECSNKAAGLGES